MIKTLGSHVEVSTTSTQNALFIGLGVTEAAAPPRPAANQPPVSSLYGGGCSQFGSSQMARAGEDAELDGVGSPIAHVLVCDDETRLGDLTAGLLEECGFAAGFVPSAVDAMAYLDAHEDTQVLLLDVNLSGGKSAHDLLTFLASRDHDLRVVLTSGSAKQEVRSELTHHPLVVGYLEKPYAEEELTAAITSALGAG
jgi:CheY-like chemotaxis protein